MVCVSVYMVYLQTSKNTKYKFYLRFHYYYRYLPVISQFKTSVHNCSYSKHWFKIGLLDLWSFSLKLKFLKDSP